MMKSFVIALLFVFIQIGLSLGRLQLAPEGRIVNGIPINANSYPWIVSLRDVTLNSTSVLYEYSYCTASLISISPPVVLTAAHCLVDWTYDSETGSIVDSSNNTYTHSLFADVNRTYPNHNVSGDLFSSLSINTSMIEIHPQYNASNFIYNDIALIIFKDHNATEEPLPVISTLPVVAGPLLDGEACCIHGDVFIAIGYGQNTTSTGPTYSLEQTTLTFVDESQCAETEAGLYWNTTNQTLIQWYIDYYYQYYVYDHINICVIGENTDICFGDSGGPLLRSTENGDGLEIVGVTSWVKGDCNNEYPSGYTSTAHFYDWIYETIDVHLGRTDEPTTTGTTTTTTTTTTGTTTTTIVVSQEETVSSNSGNIVNGLFCIYALFVSIFLGFM